MRQRIPVLPQIKTPILIILAQTLVTREYPLEPHLHLEQSQIGTIPPIMIILRMIVIKKDRLILFNIVIPKRTRSL